MIKNLGAKQSALNAPKLEARPSSNAATSHRAEPTHEQIARRAYEIFLARGGAHGNPHQDWAQAERELKLGC
jgi:hypothetical protein